MAKRTLPVVIVPCSGPLITHFWQFLGPNLEFNTFLHSDDCSVKETASQMAPLRSPRMNNRKLAHNGYTPVLSNDKGRACSSPMKLQKAETIMSGEL